MISERELFQAVNQPGARDWMAEKLVPASELPMLGVRGGLLRVVAKEGGINDWAAYADRAVHSAESVACNGNKLLAEDAAAIFPFLRIERYRV